MRSNKNGLTMNRILQIFFCAGLFCWTVDGNTQQRNCTSTKQCQVSSEQQFLYCCGDCGQSFCCENANMGVNFTRCTFMKDSTTGSWDSPMKMLGVIIGGMMASFSGAMLAHALFRICLKKLRRNSSTEQTAANASNEDSQRPTAREVHLNVLPQYEDIHLYQKVEDTSKMNEGYEASPPPYAIFVQQATKVPEGCKDSVLTISRELTENLDKVFPAEINGGESAGGSNFKTLAAAATVLGIPDQPEEVRAAMIQLLKQLDSGSEYMRTILESTTSYMYQEEATTSSQPNHDVLG